MPLKRETFQVVVIRSLIWTILVASYLYEIFKQGLHQSLYQAFELSVHLLAHIINTLQFYELSHYEIYNLFLVNHPWPLYSIVSILEYNVYKSFCALIIGVFSVNKTHVFDVLGNVINVNKKNCGPLIYPWGTPLLTDIRSELESFETTVWDRFESWMCLLLSPKNAIFANEWNIRYSQMIWLDRITSI